MIELPESPQQRLHNEKSDIDWSEEAFKAGALKDNGLAVHLRPITTFRYEGNMKGNVRDGHGVQTYADGATFEGEFRKNRFHGRGKLTLSNGDWYEGR